MRLLADECVARTIVERLRKDALDVVAAVDVCATEDDPSVLALAYAEGRVLLTEDKDFGELVVRFRQPAIGVVNIALGPIPAAARADIVAEKLGELGDSVVGRLVTIEPGRLRLRPLA